MKSSRYWYIVESEAESTSARTGVFRAKGDAGSLPFRCFVIGEQLELRAGAAKAKTRAQSFEALHACHCHNIARERAREARPAMHIVSRPAYAGEGHEESHSPLEFLLRRPGFTSCLTTALVETCTTW